MTLVVRISRLYPLAILHRKTYNFLIYKYRIKNSIFVSRNEMTTSKQTFCQTKVILVLDTIIVRQRAMIR